MPAETDYFTARTEDRYPDILGIRTHDPHARDAARRELVVALSGLTSESAP